MKILYIHQYYNTPEKGGPLRSYYLTNALIEAGHTVELITTHNAGNYRIENPKKGLTIHYLPVAYDNKMGAFSRIIAFRKFVKKAKKLSRKIKDLDLCFATSTPLTVGSIAMDLKKRQGIPYVFEVRDLWPEAPIQMGVIRNKWLKKYLYQLESKIYKSADKIIALSPGIRDYIRQIVPDKPIAVIPNMSDCQFFTPDRKDQETLKKLNLSNELVITYFGALGKANNLDYLLNCAEAALNEFGNRVHFIIVGKGSEQEHLLSAAKNRSNLTVLPFATREEIKKLLSITDLSYISFDKKKVLETSSPNKFFDSLAAGKACIVNFDGWIKDLIEKHQCGFYHDPENPKEFVNKLAPIIEERSLLLRYQRNSNELATNFFSKKALGSAFADFLTKEKTITALEPSVYTLTA